jgi:hypothetical protein
LAILQENQKSRDTYLDHKLRKNFNKNALESRQKTFYLVQNALLGQFESNLMLPNFDPISLMKRYSITLCAVLRPSETSVDYRFFSDNTNRQALLRLVPLRRA